MKQVLFAETNIIERFTYYRTIRAHKEPGPQGSVRDREVVFYKRGGTIMGEHSLILYDHYV